MREPSTAHTSSVAPAPATTRAQLEQLVTDSTQPLALVDLHRRRLVRANPAFRREFGFAADTPATELHQLLRSAAATRLIRSLAAGEVTALETTRIPGRSSTPPAPTSRLWVPDDQRPTLALWHVTTEALPMAATEGYVAADGVVGGIVDADLRIVSISRAVELGFGWRSADVVGTSSLRFVHAQDVPRFLRTVATALTERFGAAVTLRIRDRSGGYQPMRATFVPMETEPVHLTYTLAPVTAADDGQRDDPERVARWLRHLADEMEVGRPPAPVARHATVLEELTPRQRDIVTRLVRGERVPGIARKLYLSQSTVRNHLTGAFRKLGVRSQEELLERLRST